MIDRETLNQVKGVLRTLGTPLTLSVTRDVNGKHAVTFSEFVEEVASCSDKLRVVYHDGADFSFSILKDGRDTGISFRGIPNGHEFTSLLLALLNADGQGRNLPDEALARRIKRLRGPLNLSTYASLTCTNCPDVVQALNVIALYNDGISHEMVDGALYQEETDRLGIQAVPSVFCNGKSLHVGRGDLGTLLGKLEKIAGTDNEKEEPETYDFDQVILGAGPAGVAAAVFSARKGLKVAVVTKQIGGQVTDTSAIENIIAVSETSGTQLAADLLSQLEHNNVSVFTNRTFTSLQVDGSVKKVVTDGGEVFQAPQVIIATGSSWRTLGLEHEDQYMGHGIHFCPHCDGPFYKGKKVAVIGGGNSGAEAAIDLAGICSHVTLVEYAETLKADSVLQEKLRSLPNVEILTSTQTLKLHGDGNRLTGIALKNRLTNEESELDLDGLFLQIGLVPGTSLLKGVVALNDRGEIIVDDHNRTSVPNVYAAGVVSTVPFKQIIISMGDGAKASLAAFEDRMYNK